MNADDSIALEQIDCPLCSESAYRAVIETRDFQWGIPGNFTVVECERCAHRYMNPRPTIAALADCYPADYGPHQLQVQKEADDSIGAAANASSTLATPWYLRYLPLRYIPGLRRLFYWLTNERSQIIPDPFFAQSSLNDSGKPKAFELGCAAGAYISQLRDRGWDVAGVEPGNGPASAAQAAGLNVRKGTLDDVQMESASFDFAASWMVIEHVPDPRATLQQLFALLKPGGQLAISVPNAGCWETRFFGANWDAWDLPRHLQHFNPRSIRRLLQDSGFVGVNITHQRTLLNVFGSLGIALTRRNPDSRIGNLFLRYPHSPRLAIQLAAAPLAHALAFLRQGGRLTITCVRPATGVSSLLTRSGDKSKPPAGGGES